MARIPDSVVERLKKQVSVKRLVESASIELTARGRSEHVGVCPFHPQEAPSELVVLVSNNWRCESGCGGSVVDWVMRSEGVSFRHGVELLRDGHVPTRLDGAPPERSTVAKLDGSGFSVDLSDAELLDAVVGFYGETLKANPDALGYLSERRCATAEAIDVFRLGFADRTLGYRIPAANRAEGKQLRSRLRELGVLRDSGHERFRGSLVVPVADVNGAVVQIYGRKTGTGLRKGTELHAWLPEDSAAAGWVFNKASFAATGELIVCEGLIDALTMWSAGIRNVTALGPEGWTDAHSAALKAHGVGRVLIGFDRDAEGDDAAGELAGRLFDEGVELMRLPIPDGLDINDVARRSDDPVAALAGLVRNAIWLGVGPKPDRTGVATAAAVSPASLSSTGPDTPGQSVLEADGEVSGLPSAVTDQEVSAVPAGPVAAQGLVLVDGQAVVSFADRRWRLRGLEKNSSFDVLRANVLVSIEDRFHVDTLDLYSARARAVFITQAAVELKLGEDTVKRDLGRVLLAAEGLVEAAIHGAQEPEDAAVVLDADERNAALELLADPNLVDRIISDFAKVGVVGEATNLLVGYLAATSRLLARPLAVMVQSTSAAGKSQLMDAVLSFMPDEHLVRFSAMTGQSLYYLGEGDLAHKVLAIAEEEGAERAAYALKLLQSEGELSIASTGKDNASGKLVTHEYSVKGPTGIFLTTTAIDVDEELLNRCLVLTVDEDRDQTRAIHAQQRHAHTLDGLKAKTRSAEVTNLHRNAQRLLEPVVVVNPFAGQLGFADAATRTRRDHMKYLTLISAIALLHQHQRPRRTATVDGAEITYIEATKTDIDLANRLASEVLSQSLDELPPQTRRLLDLTHEMVADIAETDAVMAADVRFTRRQAREHLGWGDTQLKIHLARLVDMELVLAHRPQGAGPFRYELAWQPPTATHSRFLPGLVNPETGQICDYDSSRSGSETLRSGPGRGVVGPRSDPGRGTPDTPASLQPPQKPGPNDATGGSGPETTAPGTNNDTVVVLHTDSAPQQNPEPAERVGGPALGDTG